MLPNNYSQAFNRLDYTEKRMSRDPEIAKVYSETITQYVEKYFIRKVEETEFQDASLPCIAPG